VLLPGSVVTFAIGRDRSVALVQSVQPGDIIGTAVQRDPSLDAPFPADLHSIGTLARVRRVARVRHNTYRLVVEGLERFELGTLVQSDPYWKAYGTQVDEPNNDSDSAGLLAEALQEHMLELSAKTGGNLDQIVDQALEPGELADRVAGHLGLK